MNPLYLIAAIILSFLQLWTVYNLPILAVGIKHRNRSDQNKKKVSRPDKKALPTFSIIVPMKNEEKVADRSLKALLNLNYPSQKREIIIIEDGSTDKTAEICTRYAQRHPDHIILRHRSESNGKPSALNYATKHSKGEIIAVFDADNVPETDTLLRAAEYFEDPSIAAVQGTTSSINADENMLTKFVSYEETAWLRTYIQGKDALNLFVPLTGSCQFIRRNILERVNGWDEESLSEDVEMSAKLTEKGYRIKYAPDILSWQETPANITQLIRQRTRWFRGYMETAVKYGRLLRNINKRNIDAEMTLLAPYTFTMYLLIHFTALQSFVAPPSLIFQLAVWLASILNIVTLLLLGVVLAYVTKPRKITNLLWLPFVYAYWIIQTFVALRALIQIILKKPRKWTKTPKSGKVCVLHPQGDKAEEACAQETHPTRNNLEKKSNKQLKS